MTQIFDDMKERLLQLADYKGLSVRAFEQECGLQRGNISNMSENGAIGSDKLSKIIDAISEVNIEWLITGKGAMLKNENTALSDTSNQQLSISQFKQKGYAPFYSDMPVSAGQYGLVNIEQREKPESWIKYPGVEADGWFPVIGCSMEPKIHAGDIVGVKQLDRWERIDPDKVYMIITHDDRMIKHIETDDNDNTILWAISTNFKRFPIDKNDIIRIYRIVWVGRPV